jgi:hypothetical protein
MMGIDMWWHKVMVWVLHHHLVRVLWLAGMSVVGHRVLHVVTGWVG